MNTASSTLYRRRILTALVLGTLLVPLLSVWQSFASRAHAQQGPGSPFSVYLPYVDRGPAGDPPPPDEEIRGALYFENVGETASADIAVDAQGGMHAVFVDSLPLVELPAAHYRYCASPAANCANPVQWAEVTFGDRVEEVQLELTQAGQPRLLIQSREEQQDGKEYLYAACDTGCTNQANWSVTSVTYTIFTAIADVGDYRNPQRYFALDPQGRPGFVFYDRNFLIEPDRIGVFFATCSDACNSTEGWTITPIGSTAEQDIILNFERPSLAFTSLGQPRIVSHVSVTTETGGGISFIGCDANCDVGDNWERVVLYPRGQGIDFGWDIALDAQDRPRIAAFPEELSNGSGEQLYYFWCDGSTLAACLDINNWSGTNLGLGVDNGLHPDLELDAQGRPRIAWITASGSLGYTWCVSGCETAQSEWLYEVAESTTAMKAANPQALPPNCDQDLWEVLAPVLVLDAAGNPRIAYDVLVEGRCMYSDPTDPTRPPTSRFEEIWRGARVMFFPQS